MKHPNIREVNVVDILFRFNLFYTVNFAIRNELLTYANINIQMLYDAKCL